MNLDPTLSYNIDEKYDKKNNSIDYRLKEAKTSNMTYVDFSNLTIPNIDFLLKIDLLSNIKHLFLNQNNIKGELNLTLCNNLLTLDVTSNQINEINVCSTLIELTIDNNLIKKLPININLHRLKCSNNQLEKIPCYSNLELLNASSNKITKLESYPKLRELTIIDNPLNKLELQPQLYFIDISKTNLSDLDNFAKSLLLIHLIANSSKLIRLPRINSLRFIEVINTYIDRIHWFENYELILCSYSCVKHVSNKYISSNANIQVRNSEICITKCKSNF
jgi:hypothetical protein